MQTNNMLIFLLYILFVFILLIDRKLLRRKINKTCDEFVPETKISRIYKYIEFTIITLLSPVYYSTFKT